MALFAIRKTAPLWQRLLLGLLCLGGCYGLWWYVTAGIPEERILSPAELPSPAETFASFKTLWFDRALTRNAIVTVRRVTLGFSLAALVGIPIGVLCGCFSRVAGFFAPLTIFGRNIPIAALIPLTFSIFGIDEGQKIMFIFIATIAFVVSDTAHAIQAVEMRYIDTAYTLGANRRQVILKVLVPLAMPTVFNALRVLFGLAFGYIMLAELVKFGGEEGGLGDIIVTSQRRNVREHVVLVLLLIPILAMAIDRILYWVQRQLFPHAYGGMGLLSKALGGVLAGWELLKGLLFRYAPDGEPEEPEPEEPEDPDPSAGKGGKQPAPDQPSEDSEADMADVRAGAVADDDGDSLEALTDAIEIAEREQEGDGEEVAASVKPVAVAEKPAPEPKPEPKEVDPRSPEGIANALAAMKKQMGLGGDDE